MIGLLMLMLLCFMCAALFKAALPEFVFGLGTLNYNPGGLRVPLGYTVPTMPYLPPVASTPASWWTFLTGTSASYNTKNIYLRRNEADGSFTTVQFQYYNTGGGPSLPIVGINVTGLTTAVQVRNATRTALIAQGFIIPAVGTASMRVQQPFPGDQGDVAFVGDFFGNAIIVWTINGYQEPISPLSVYGNSIFFGYELSAPAIIGRTRGMVPVSPAPFNGGS